jgi:spermidine synthase
VQVIGAIGIVFMIALSAHGVGESGQIFWSPYYKIAYVPQGRGIDTNNISHQQMIDIDKEGSGYVIPHLLNRDVGGTPFEEVMIIGAGSGNDVATALRYGAKHIDAVEIDPRIQMIGWWDHPNHPYGQFPEKNPRVTVHLDDGRSFARKTTKKYDLAIYALVDSLVLHSGYSSLRLENFLFTKQAFEDIKKTLKPDGVFAVYNYFRQGWVVGRLQQMGKEVFGVDPIVISMPYQDVINPWTNQSDQSEKPHRTFVLMGNDAKKIEAIRQKFSESSFWVNYSPEANEHMNGFRKSPPDPNDKAWEKIAPATVVLQPKDTNLSDDQRASVAALAYIPQDNWPQLYLREKKIPWQPTGQGMLTIAVLSAALLLIFGGPAIFSRREPTLITGTGRARFNFQMFFLGAGFMLLETKGVVHMALLFGSTWIVNSVVFFAILVMILIANLFTLALKPRNLLPYYALLIIALLVNALVPMDWFLSLEVKTRTIASCAVVFIPVFFAGVIFASAFRDSRRPDVDFGCNVAGIILGGLSEQLSLKIGFNYLLFLAIAYYVLSFLLAPRRRELETAPTSTPVIEETPPPTPQPVPVPT